MNSYKYSGMVIRDHDFIVPLDHQKQQGEKITVFVREIIKDNRECSPSLSCGSVGGEGGCPRPRALQRQSVFDTVKAS